MKSNATGTRKVFARRLAATTGVLLATTAGSAAAVEIEVLDLHPVHNGVSVAILGGPDFKPNDVIRRSLVFGWSEQGRDGGFVPAVWASRKLRDVDGDGHRDRIVVFRLSDPDFQALSEQQDVAQVEVRGVYQDGLFQREFVSQAMVVEDGDPISGCAAVQGQEGTTTGVRCSWQKADGSAYKPINLEDLVSELNQEFDSEIDQQSVAVLEAYGGKGEKGSNNSSILECTAKGGDGGAAGYARTILTVADLPADLFIYPGKSGDEHQAGGAGTVVASVDIAGLTKDQLESTTPADVVADGVLAIGGGGGGGGSGRDVNTECYHGGYGGAGGVAIADTSGDAMGAGADGTHGDPGSGGDGSGGDGDPDGSNGIGGPGGEGQGSSTDKTGGGPLWAGWSSTDDASYTSNAWAYGAGGTNAGLGGAGGGGFGGGGQAKGKDYNHQGGGGGGGSMAMQSTVAEDTIQGDGLIHGPNAESQVKLTFQFLSAEE
jgi:hypothetical protein